MPEEAKVKKSTWKGFALMVLGIAVYAACQYAFQLSYFLSTNIGLSKNDHVYYSEGEIEDVYETMVNQTQTWSIFLYLSGGDLETKNGFGTKDLAEIQSVYLPDNIQMIIQTGGARTWHNNYVTSESLSRFLYRGKKLELLEKMPLDNMGKRESLESFLSYCNDNYRADNNILIFSGHGLGNLGGVAHDELYGNDSLSVMEIKKTLQRIYGLSPKSPPLSMIGFDACYMATLEIANTLEGYASYMVASEAQEPSSGWDYAAMLKALQMNPGMSVASFGKEICEDYAKGTSRKRVITLALIDLENLTPLLRAYQNLGVEALSNVYENPCFTALLRQSSEDVERYEDNDLVDLGSFVNKARLILPQTSQALLNALKQCVVYRVYGTQHEGSYGITCFFPYSMNFYHYLISMEVGSSESHRHLYSWMLRGEMDRNCEVYIKQMAFE